MKINEWRARQEGHRRHTATVEAGGVAVAGAGAGKQIGGATPPPRPLLAPQPSSPINYH